MQQGRGDIMYPNLANGEMVGLSVEGCRGFRSRVLYRAIFGAWPQRVLGLKYDPVA